MRVAKSGARYDEAEDDRQHEYHKLIRWRIIVHGGIDGYSCLVTYLKASNNNRATTAFSAFEAGVSEYGIPSRVRTDRGGENVEIARYMLQHPARGPGRGSIITARSVHNQRLERLWRDLFTGCIGFFYRLFYEMEDEGLLCVDDVCDLYALHSVFLPTIQTSLMYFVRAGLTTGCELAVTELPTSCGSKAS